MNRKKRELVSFGFLVTILLACLGLSMYFTKQQGSTKSSSSYSETGVLRLRGSNTFGRLGLKCTEEGYKINAGNAFIAKYPFEAVEDLFNKGTEGEVDFSGQIRWVTVKGKKVDDESLLDLVGYLLQRGDSVHVNILHKGAPGTGFDAQSLKQLRNIFKVHVNFMASDSVPSYPAEADHVINAWSGSIDSLSLVKGLAIISTRKSFPLFWLNGEDTRRLVYDSIPFRIFIEDICSLVLKWLGREERNPFVSISDAHCYTNSLFEGNTRHLNAEMNHSIMCEIALLYHDIAREHQKEGRYHIAYDFFGKTRAAADPRSAYLMHRDQVEDPTVIDAAIAVKKGHYGEVLEKFSQYPEPNGSARTSEQERAYAQLCGYAGLASYMMGDYKGAEERFGDESNAYASLRRQAPYERADLVAFANYKKYIAGLRENNKWGLRRSEGLDSSVMYQLKNAWGLSDEDGDPIAYRVAWFFLWCQWRLSKKDPIGESSWVAFSSSGIRNALRFYLFFAKKSRAAWHRISPRETGN